LFKIPSRSLPSVGTICRVHSLRFPQASFPSGTCFLFFSQPLLLSRVPFFFSNALFFRKVPCAYALRARHSPSPSSFLGWDCSNSVQFFLKLKLVFFPTPALLFFSAVFCVFSRVVKCFFVDYIPLVTAVPARLVLKESIQFFPFACLNRVPL